LDAWDHRKVTGPKHELIGKSPTARNETVAAHAKTGGKTALIGEIPVTSRRRRRIAEPDVHGIMGHR
jgi:hypothetical protein